MINHFSALGIESIYEILKQSGDATAIYTDRDLKIGFVNNAMLKIWGKEESITGQRFQDALPEMEGQPFAELLKNVWLNGEIYEAVNTPATILTDGILTTSYFDFTFKPIFNDDGQAFCILHTAKDVSERLHAQKAVNEKTEIERLISKQLAEANRDFTLANQELNDTNDQLTAAYHKLADTENRMQELISSTPVGLAFLKGPEMTVETANPEMKKILGIGNGAFVGQPLLEVFPMLNGQVFYEQLEKVYESGAPSVVESAVFYSNAETNLEKKYLNIYLTPLLDSEDHTEAIIVTILDITHKVIAGRALQASETTLQKYSEELNAFSEEFTTLNDQLQKANQRIEYLDSRLRSEHEKAVVKDGKHSEALTKADLLNSSLRNEDRDVVVLNDTISDLNQKISDSKTSFGNLISQAPAAIMLLKGDDFVVSMVNKAMLEIIGKDESIIGKRLFDEMPELRGQGAADMLIETYQTGISKGDHSNLVHIQRHGTMQEGYFNFTYTPYIEDGKVVGVIDMAVEVTPQMEAVQEREQIILEKTTLEETLRASEQRLHSILETMAEGVGVTDAVGQLVYANPMAQQILGLKESSIKERTFDDPQWQNLRIDGSPLPPDEHPMAIMMKTGKPVFDHEIAVQPPDRERFYISINAAPLFDTEGQLSGGIGTFMDVTTRRMIAQGKDDFISIASHELKTPVTSLKASLQLLQRSSDRLSPETRSRLLEQSIKSLDKLNRLINDLLDASRLEQGQIKIIKSTFSVHELFEDCSSNLTQTVRDKSAFTGDTHLMIEADSQQIGQVLINFITNADKYAPESEIEVNARKLDTGEIKISVKDSGPGIAEDQLKHLFDRYYRTDHSGQKFSGLGLGLYISSDIIKNHGGKIGIDSTVGQGSEFWFTIPHSENYHK